MLDPNTINYQKMGFRAGLEVHHQIETRRKLFCNCKPYLINGVPDYRFERYFRPVLGEMGDFDEGMLVEFEKGYHVIYHAHDPTVCIYEQDEQPPFWPDYEAIYHGFELALWLNFSALVDEVIVNRKQYLDGSITTGFQRTMIVARDGYVEVNGKKIRISNLTVEEDSARKIKTENNGRTVYYNLDRLGIPLVEVITDHEDCDNPTDLRKAAEMIGLTLRLSGIGKRGIGTARQDVNLSITGGNRVEIKGVQNLSLFEELSRREVIRQDMLINIAKMLKDRNFKKDDLEHTYVDLTELFESVPESLIVMGIRLPNFGDVLSLEVQPGKDFAQDIFEKADLISGIPKEFMFHSGELSNDSIRRKKSETEGVYFFDYIDENVDRKIKEALNIKENTNVAYVIAMGRQNWAIHALKKVIERAKMAVDGVPQETRRVLPNGNSEFLRVIHGKDRLYPDTDTPPINIDIQKVQNLKKKVGKRPWELEKEYGEKYGLSYIQLLHLIRHNLTSDFVNLIEKYDVSAKHAIYWFEGVRIALNREGVRTNNLSLEQIANVLKMVENGQCDLSKAPEIIKQLAEAPQKPLEIIIKDLKLQKINPDDLERYYQEAKKVFEEYLDRVKISSETTKYRVEKLTGIIMSKIAGSLPGRTVHQFVLDEEVKHK